MNVHARENVCLRCGARTHRHTDVDADTDADTDRHTEAQIKVQIKEKGEGHPAEVTAKIQSALLSHCFGICQKERKVGRRAGEEDSDRACTVQGIHQGSRLTHELWQCVVQSLHQNNSGKQLSLAEKQMQGISQDSWAYLLGGE